MTMNAQCLHCGKMGAATYVDNPKFLESWNRQHPRAIPRTVLAVCGVRCAFALGVKCGRADAISDFEDLERRRAREGRP